MKEEIFPLINLSRKVESLLNLGLVFCLFAWFFFFLGCVCVFVVLWGFFLSCLFFKKTNNYSTLAISNQLALPFLSVL